MKTQRKTILILLSLMMISLLLSCSSVQKPMQVIIQPEPEPVEKQQNISIANRFRESAFQNPTVVESAMELSKKYFTLSEEAVVLRQLNKELIVQNKQLGDKAAALDTQLKQAQKELNEANNFLIEMRVELNNWKVNILGFRDEMRGAEKAQLEALFKILKALGGEVKVETAHGKGTGPAVASLSKPDGPK